MAESSILALATKTRVWLTVAGILLFIAVILVSFVNRIQQPRVMTLTEMQINGLYVFDTPRDPGGFTLIDQRGCTLHQGKLKRPLDTPVFWVYPLSLYLPHDIVVLSNAEERAGNH